MLKILISFWCFLYTTASLSYSCYFLNQVPEVLFFVFFFFFFKLSQKKKKNPKFLLLLGIFSWIYSEIGNQYALIQQQQQRRQQQQQQALIPNFVVGYGSSID